MCILTQGYFWMIIHFYLVELFKIEPSCIMPRHNFVPVSVKVNFKFLVKVKAIYFLSNLIVSNMMPYLATLLATDVTWYDLSFYQCRCSHLKWSSRLSIATFHNGIYCVSETTHEVWYKWYNEILIIDGVQLVSKIIIIDYKVAKGHSRKDFRTVVLIVSMWNYTVFRCDQAA